MVIWRRLLTFLLVGFISLVISPVGCRFHGSIPLLEVNAQPNSFRQILDLVENNYVKVLEPRELVYPAIRGMTRKLDPYSYFLDPSTQKEVEVEIAGSFGGVGLEIGMRDQQIIIISPIEESPAWRAGIRSGDHIVRIDGISTAEMDVVEASKRIRGSVGTPVSLIIARDSKEMEFVLVREMIKIVNVREEILHSKVGYIRINSFLSQYTTRDLDKVLVKFQQQGVDRLILDLRNNSGGQLNEAVKVASRFLEQGTIVTIQGRSPADKETMKAQPEGRVFSYPLVVLVNNGSASASEIVASAIQENYRGILLGTTTFGKGVVQQIFPFDDGSSLWLVVSRYFTPQGHSIHQLGIQPDVVIEEFPASPEFQKKLDSLYQGNYLSNFIREHPQYSQEDVLNFHKQLLGKKIDLTVEELKRLIALETIDREDDLATDIQLLKAVEILENESEYHKILCR